MAKITIEIKIDNDAFNERPEVEVADILNGAARKLKANGLVRQRLQDYNGNTVGLLEVEK